MDSTAGPRTDVAHTSSTEESSTGPWVDPDCPDIHEGSVYIDARYDVDSLRFTGRVDGYVFIEWFDGTDLQFLGCLHVVEGGVVIRNNLNLTSLTGLENLSYIGNGFAVNGSPLLETLGGIPPVTTLKVLDVSGNESLLDVDLPDLEDVETLALGMCHDGPSPLLDNPLLQTLDGLSGLKSFDRVVIGSQSALTSISRLHEIAAEGGAFVRPAGPSYITSNPSLPFEQVQVLSDIAMARGHVLHHCDNLGEPDGNACNCEFGE